MHTSTQCVWHYLNFCPRLTIKLLCFAQSKRIIPVRCEWELWFWCVRSNVRIGFQSDTVHGGGEVVAFEKDCMCYFYVHFDVTAYTQHFSEWYCAAFRWRKAFQQLSDTTIASKPILVTPHIRKYLDDYSIGLISCRHSA